MSIHKKLLLFLASILCFLLLTSCGSRHHYTPEDRLVLSAQIHEIRVDEPGLETNTVIADFIVQGVVTSEGTELPYTMKGEGMDEGVPLIATKFTVRVQETWFGEPVSGEIAVCVPGKVDGNPAKPRKDDHVILFLSGSNGANRETLGDYYRLVDGEYSVFIINPPDDTLFAFSDLPAFTAFDGAAPETLKSAVKETIVDILAQKEPGYRSEHGVLRSYGEEMEREEVS